MDHFEVFGLPRRLGIDVAQLQRAFYELSRRSHPDFHQSAPPERQAVSPSGGGQAPRTRRKKKRKRKRR